MTIPVKHVFVVRTNFTGTRTDKHEFALADLARPRNLDILRHVFFEPEKLKPGLTSAAITTEAAGRLAAIAQNLRERGLDRRHVARFLDCIVFCLFAEDVELLPKELFLRVTENSKRDPVRFSRLVSQLLEAMAHGGDFGADAILHFNGNLFDESPVLTLTPTEIDSLAAAAKLDWSAIDPSIFGTLFERGMDPNKRSHGAHYTSREDIETLVEPDVMQPLRREWTGVKGKVESLLAAGKADESVKGEKLTTERAAPPESHKLLLVDG